MPTTGTFLVKPSRALKEACGSAPENKKRKRPPEELVGLKCEKYALAGLYKS